MEIENNKEINVNTKKIFIIISSIILVICIGITISTSVNPQVGELNKMLKEMGDRFYSEYYDALGGTDESKGEFLKRYSNTGIKVNLEYLSSFNDGEYSEKVSKFVNKKTKKECNKTNTKVIIYPTDPYGEKDYKLETELDCSFN